MLNEISGFALLVGLEAIHDLVRGIAIFFAGWYWDKIASWISFHHDVGIGKFQILLAIYGLVVVIKALGKIIWSFILWNDWKGLPQHENVV